MQIIKSVLFFCIVLLTAGACAPIAQEVPVMWNPGVDSLLHDSSSASLLIDSLRHKILAEGPVPAGIKDMNQLAQISNGEAMRWFAEAAYNKAKQLRDSYGQTEAICSKAAYYNSNGDNELAGLLLDSCYSAARQLGYKTLQAKALLYKGRIYADESHQSMAEGFFGQGIVIARETGDRQLEATFLRNVGNMYFMQDGYDSCISYYKRALDIATTIHDESQEAECLNKIGDGYRMRSDFDSSIPYFNKAIALSYTIRDQRQLASCLSNIGNGYYLKDENNQALGYFRQAIDIARAIHDEDQEAFCLSSIGEVYRMQNDYARSLHYFSQAMAIAKRTHNDYRISDCLSSMGAIYQAQDENEKALDYFQQAIAIGRETNDKNRVAYCLSSIGEVYSDKTEYTRALDYYRQSLNIANEIGDKIRISDCLASIGKLYLTQNHLAKQKNSAEVTQRYKVALDYFRRAMVVSEEIDDKNQTVDCLTNIGDVYLQTGDIEQARSFGEKSLDLAKVSNMPENIKTSAELLYQIYDRKNNYKGAFDMLRLYLEMKDSINNEKNVKNFVSQEFNVKNEEMKLEQSKKEIMYKAEQIKKEAELKRQKTLRYAFTAGFLLLLALAIVVFRNLQQNKKKNRIITLQKQEVETKSHLLEQKNKEVMDSIHYAQRIQHALMASDSLLTNSLSAAGASYFVYFTPKDVVSGDFYWAAQSHGKFYLVFADSTGHGVPGAFMSLLNISFLNEAINEKGLRRPDEILSHVRSKLIQSFAEDGSSEGGKDGMDCSLLCFDFAAGVLEFSCANNPIILVRDNTILEQPSDRMPVGKSPKETVPYTLHRLALQKGDVIYAFTDGYIDQFGGPKSKKFMYKKLNGLLLSCHQAPLHEQKTLLNQVFTDWKGNLEQVDDVLVAGIRI